LQVSAVTPQLAHAEPVAPHWAWLGVTHAPPLQQPIGQLVESQTQLPPTQRWPAPQVSPPPHAHIPNAQLSEVDVQVTQFAPPPPQAIAVGGATQVCPLQQPDRQLVLLHTHAPA
jgi:hypothetical protein